MPLYNGGCKRGGGWRRGGGIVGELVCEWFPFDIDDVYLFRWKWKIYKMQERQTSVCVLLCVWVCVYVCILYNFSFLSPPVVVVVCLGCLLFCSVLAARRHWQQQLIVGASSSSSISHPGWSDSGFIFCATTATSLTYMKKRLITHRCCRWAVSGFACSRNFLPFLGALLVAPSALFFANFLARPFAILQFLFVWPCENI